ncbi:MAG: hypothetical protein IT560_01115, partial [Alphaproteobacteria bacterium]|nr:hypothetical protein [Alphaproteobacteria bacterium]
MKNNALYYPSISLKNPPLIKTMALFYENIYRIKPDGVKLDDSKDLAALLEEGSVGRTIAPNDYSKEASAKFLAKKDNWSAAALCLGEEEEN